MSAFSPLLPLDGFVTPECPKDFTFATQFSAMHRSCRGGCMTEFFKIWVRRLLSAHVPRRGNIFIGCGTKTEANPVRDVIANRYSVPYARLLRPKRGGDVIPDGICFPWPRDSRKMLPLRGTGIGAAIRFAKPDGISFHRMRCRQKLEDAVALKILVVRPSRSHFVAHFVPQCPPIISFAAATDTRGRIAGAATIHGPFVGWWRLCSR